MQLGVATFPRKKCVEYDTARGRTTGRTALHREMVFFHTKCADASTHNIVCTGVSGRTDGRKNGSDPPSDGSYVIAATRPASFRKLHGRR